MLSGVHLEHILVFGGCPWAQQDKSAKRMIKHEKFNENEVNDCVRELEKRNRVMFDKEEGTIFWI